ncbi:MAG: rod shape-determining protein MreC [Chloroflexi bacterium]|nr:rod shape-determining protein MreC [Chloroflexota bacterium]
MHSRTDTPTALIVAIIVLIAAFLVSQTGLFRPVRDLATTLLAPVQDQFSRLSRTVSDWVQGGRDMVALREENRDLRAQLDRLSVQLLQLEEANKEIEHLRALLNFTQTYPAYQFKGAEVVGYVVGSGASNLFPDLVLNVGARDGIRRNMPVVTERGLVGRVLDVYPNACRVLLIVDARSSVNAMIQRNRVTGLVEGRPGGKLVMTHIPHDSSVAEGDVVITSGLGGMFPKALIIGQVSKVIRDEVGLYQEAEVQPTVDFGGLERALVITNFTPTEVP